MNRTDIAKWMRLAGLAAMLACFDANGDDCCEEGEGEEECECEHTAPQHLHFSSRDFDIYEANEDAVYRDADWPSKIEEYSDYLSK